MTDQIHEIQHIGIRTMMDILKNMPLPSSLMQWNKVILIQVTDQNNLNYVWVIHDGQWNILEGETQEPDFIFRGKEITFVKNFTKEYNSNNWPTPPRGLKDAMKFGTLTGSIIAYLRNLSPQLIAEAEQRQTEALALKETADNSQTKQPTFLDEEIDLLVNKPEQLKKSSVGCPKCKSKKIALQTYWINPKNGEKIPVAIDSMTIGIFALVGGILLFAFGLLLLIALLVGGGIGNILFTISAIIFLILSGLKVISEGIRIINANRQQQGHERIIEYTCNTCKMVWKEGDVINK